MTICAVAQIERARQGFSFIELDVRKTVGTWAVKLLSCSHGKNGVSARFEMMPTSPVHQL